MESYLILGLIMVIIYFGLVRNRPKSQSDWESLPTLNEYQKQQQATNEQGQLSCIHCQSSELVEKPLRCEKENPNKTKHYHACTKCKVILWRSELQSDTQTN